MSNKKVCKFIMVGVNSDDDVKKGKSKQNNKFYNMFEQEDGTFKFEYGRVDVTSQGGSKPMSKWDSVIKSKVKKGYKDITHLYQEEGGADSESSSSIVDIPDHIINKLFKELQAYADNTIQSNYKVSSAKVTQAMIDEAQSFVDGLAIQLKASIDKDIFNKVLLELYHVIPRKMRDVRDFLLADSNKLDEEARKLLESEQSLLDVMAGQVIVNVKSDTEDEDVSETKNILDVLGLKVKPSSSEEISIIKKHLGPNAHQFRSAYSVINTNTQGSFDNHIECCNSRKTELFWHGSRNQNWLNIISTGLLIRPSGAIYSGSMFGDGIYFADKAQKSIGYSSLRGSYWSRGGDDKAYLALFSVNVGNQKHIERWDRSCYSLSQSTMNNEGFDSVYAHDGADLRNSEYIVYQPQQCTISYLVEIGS